MAFEDEAPLERAYPYRTGWQVIGCTALFFGLLGAGGAALIPFGCEKIGNGQLPLGIAFVIIGLFGAPMLLMALLAVYTGIRDSIRPPLLRVTPTALLLPHDARSLRPEEEQQDERGEPKDRNPPLAHPEEIPFTAIRWVRREGPPNDEKLMLVHDLSQSTLVIQKYMMNPTDFDELETVLRAAIPNAFASAPPPPSA